MFCGVLTLLLVSLVAAYWAAQSPARVRRMNSLQRFLWIWCARFTCLADPLLYEEDDPRIPTNIDLVGKMVVASSPLKPRGYVEEGGLRYLAFSHDGTLIETGERLMVVDSKGGELLVRRLKDDEGNETASQ